jgi:hypothetical protein
MAPLVAHLRWQHGLLYPQTVHQGPREGRHDAERARPQGSTRSVPLDIVLSMRTMKSTSARYDAACAGTVALREAGAPTADILASLEVEQDAALEAGMGLTAKTIGWLLETVFFEGDSWNR